MDYKKSGNAKVGKNAPRHSEHNAKGSDKNPFGKGTDKAALLARIFSEKVRPFATAPAKTAGAGIAVITCG